MNGVKCTEGPWSIFKETRNKGEVIEQEICFGVNEHQNGPKGTVCKVISGNAPDGYLIAAAPELYEALEEIILSEDDGIFEALGIDLCDKISDAYAKARGEQ